MTLNLSDYKRERLNKNTSQKCITQPIRREEDATQF